MVSVQCWSPVQCTGIRAMVIWDGKMVRRAGMVRRAVCRVGPPCNVGPPWCVRGPPCNGPPCRMVLRARTHTHLQ